MIRNTLSLVTLMLISALAPGLQSASHAQSIGGMFKIRPANDLQANLQVNAYYDSTGAPAGSFYIANSAWNFSGSYQYTALGCSLSFGRDLRNNVISSKGCCFGTLFNYYYIGSRTKVMASTSFTSLMGINTVSVSMVNFVTGEPLVTYVGMNATSGWMALTNN